MVAYRSHKAKPRMLFVAGRLPYPADRGDRVRTWNFLQEFATICDVDLVCLADGVESEKARNALAPVCRAFVVPQTKSSVAVGLIRSIANLEPLQVGYFANTKMIQLVEAMGSHGYDLMYVNMARMAPYAAPVTRAYRILDMTDIVSSELRSSLAYRKVLARPILMYESHTLRSYEIRKAIEFDESWVATEREKEQLLARAPKASVHVIPNGVDGCMFAPSVNARSTNRIGFVGHLGVAHNKDAVVHFCENVLPAVQGHVPGVEFAVAGQGGNWIRRNRRTRLKATWVGYVECLNEFLQTCSVLVAPLRFSAGVQNKVLEGMAGGVPIITYPCVAEGLGSECAQYVGVARDGAEMALLVSDWLQRREFLAGRLVEARKRVLGAWRWGMARERILTILGAFESGKPNGEVSGGK